tara:strand:- start:1072 stop:1536 length:465 start_codon:yes stop_codon:yes gene_type:complete
MIKMTTQNIIKLFSDKNNREWTSKWYKVDQELINSFAEVTQDSQFIHIDRDKAKRTKFGTTIAHGFLTISLLSAMYYDAVPESEDMKMGINMGFDKLRFLAPVKCDDSIRGVFMLSNIVEKQPKTIKLTWATKVEIEGNSKPALVASWIEQQYL